MMAAAAVDMNQKVISMNLDILEEQRGHVHQALDHYVDEVIYAGRQWTTSIDRNQSNFLEIYRLITKAITSLCLKCDEMKCEQMSHLTPETSHSIGKDEFTQQQKHVLMDSGVHNNYGFFGAKPVTTHGHGKEDATEDVRNAHSSGKPNLESDHQTGNQDVYKQFTNIIGKRDGVDRELNRKLTNLKYEVESLKSNVGSIHQNVEAGNTLMEDCYQKVAFLQLVVSCLSDKVDGVNSNMSANNAQVQTDLSAKVAQLNTDLSANIAQVQADLSDKFDQSNTDLSDKVYQINTDLSAKVNQINRDLSAKVNQLNTDLSDKVEQLDTDLSDKVDQINTDMSAKVNQINTDLSDRVEQIDKDLSDKVEQSDTELSAKVNQINRDLSAKVNQLNTDLSDKVEQIDTDLSYKVYQINTDLSAKVNQINTDRSVKVNQINTDLSDKIEQSNTDLSDKIEQSNTDLSDKIEQSNTDLSDKIEQSNTDLSDKIEQSNTDLSDKIEQSNTDLSSNVVQVQQQLDEVEANYTVIRELLVKRLVPLEKLRDILNGRATKQNENVRQLRAVMKTMTDLSNKIETGVSKRDVGVSGFNAKTMLTTSSAAFSIVGSFDPPRFIAECQFNSSTGIFAASLAGMYLAYVSVYLYEDGQVGVYLIHRETSSKVSSQGLHQQICCVQAENKGSSMCNIGMLQLKVGDELFIRMTDGCCATRLIQFSCFRIGS